MRDRNRNVFDAGARREFPGHATEPKRRFSAGQIRHFDVYPAHAVPPARAERFHRRFLHSESSGVAFKRIPVPFAVFNFKRREEPRNETLAIALDGRLDPIDLRDVHAHSDDHARPLSCAAAIGGLWLDGIIPIIESAHARLLLAMRG